MLCQMLASCSYYLEVSLETSPFLAPEAKFQLLAAYRKEIQHEETSDC
uniref:Uncharacterized protein n=1 Tax=Rhizophora mucronata TaxID=61149 RepID=A0A2P2Q225_RHIMU